MRRHDETRASVGGGGGGGGRSSEWDSVLRDGAAAAPLHLLQQPLPPLPQLSPLPGNEADPLSWIDGVPVRSPAAATADGGAAPLVLRTVPAVVVASMTPPSYSSSSSSPALATAPAPAPAPAPASRLSPSLASSEGSVDSAAASARAVPSSKKRQRAPESTKYDRQRRKRIGVLIKHLGKLTGNPGGSHAEILEAASNRLSSAVVQQPPQTPPRLSVHQLVSAELAQAIAVFDMRGSLVMGNSACSRLLGFRRVDMAAGLVPMERVSPPATQPMFRMALAIAVEGRFSSGRDTSPWMHSDGRQLWMSCNGNALWNEVQPHSSLLVTFLTPVAPPASAQPCGGIEVRAKRGSPVVEVMDMHEAAASAAATASDRSSCDEG